MTRCCVEAAYPPEIPILNSVQILQPQMLIIPVGLFFSCRHVAAEAADEKAVSLTNCTLCMLALGPELQVPVLLNPNLRWHGQSVSTGQSARNMFSALCPDSQYSKLFQRS